MSGRNWGDAVIDGSTLVFNVAGKPAFRIPLTDVGQVCVTQHMISYYHNMHCRAVACHQDTVLSLCNAAHILHCHQDTVLSLCNAAHILQCHKFG